MAVSDPKIFLLSIIKGIKDNRLISRPIHIPNHEEDERVIILPINKHIKKIIFEIEFIIKKKRTITFIIGV